MPLTTTFEATVDTAMCSAQQIHPWVLMGIGMNGWAKFLAEHLVPFRALVTEHSTGVVIASFDLQYHAPCTFFHTDQLRMTFTAKARKDGRLLLFREDFHAGDVHVAELNVLGRIVRIADRDSLSARPGRLPDALMERFGPDDRFGGSVPRVLASATQDIEWSPVTSSTIHLHRGYCEAADQWSFTEVPRMVAEAREAWALGHGDDPRSGPALGAPVRRVVAELTRPMFIFDVANVSIESDGPGSRYLYRIQGAKHVHGTVYEELRT